MKKLTKWRLKISIKKASLVSIFLILGTFCSYLGPIIFIEKFSCIPWRVAIFTTIGNIVFFYIVYLVYFYIKSDEQSVIEFLQDKMYKIRLKKKFNKQSILGEGKLFNKYCQLDNNIEEIREEESCINQFLKLKF
jgi:hypothetical protein